MIRMTNSSALCASIFVALLLATPRIEADQPTGNRSGPPSTSSAGATPIDLALAQDGMLHGTVLDASGLAAPNTTVRLVQNQRAVAQTVTDAQGRFTIAQVRGGTYLLATSESAGVYRVWAPGTAPPAAKPNALLVNGPVVRGRIGAHGGGGHAGGTFGGINLPSIHPAQWLRSPVMIGTAIGGAIAVPVALHDDEFAS